MKDTNLKRIAVVQIRGAIGMKKVLKDTLKFLHLYKKNCCSIINSTASYIGMLGLVKDYVTWGELNRETFKLLLDKRGKLPGKKPLTESYLKEKLKLNFEEFAEQFISFKRELKDVPGLKSFFRLKPPVHGFERGGIKKPYSMGGSLGYRKEAINDLIKRML